MHTLSSFTRSKCTYVLHPTATTHLEAKHILHTSVQSTLTIYYYFNYT